MFWAYIRLFRSLSVLQHLVVFLTTFAIPVSFELVQGWQNTGFCPSCANWGKLALYFGWYQVAMLVIASASKQDRARVEEKLDRVFSELTDSISQIREEHQRQMTGMQDRVRDLRDWVRNIDRSMRDELGVDLPPPTVSLRASFRAGAPTFSANVTVSGPAGRRARLLRWVRRQACNLRRWARKTLVDWEQG